MRRSLRIAWVVLVAASLGVIDGTACLAATLYVAPGGADSNPGTNDRPLATLAQARDAIRKLRQVQPLPRGGITVELAAGSYAMAGALELQAEDSGTEDAPIVYRAKERGKAILSGGVVLHDWRPVSDPEILNRLDESARKAVVWTLVGRDLLDELPGFANGFGTKRPEYPIALFQSDQRLPVARWPNEGSVNTGECLGNSLIAGHTGRTFTDGVFRFEDPRLARWVGEPDLWFYGLWFQHWAGESIHLKAIDTREQTIALANTHVFGFKKGQGFYAFNAISEIDRPGEWALDRASRRLYLWPAADVKTNPPTMSRCDSLVKADKLANVTFDGLVFEACRQDALTFRNCTAVTIAASTVRHVGGWAVTLKGGERGAVVGCDLYDLGEGGASVAGGNRDTLTPGGHLIENNRIHHFARLVRTYRPGAAAYGVGNTIRHNLIYQADHQAISFDGNDHVIEYNIVHDVCLHTSDAGPVYACTRDWTHRGTVIRHNLIHAPGQGLDGAGCRDICMDDHTSETNIYSNIVTEADTGINLGGGKDNRITNNIVVNCRRESISLHSRGIDSFARVDAQRGRESPIYKVLEGDLYKTDLWRKRYPNMLAPLDMDPIEAKNAHGNLIRDNLIAGGPEVRVDNAPHVMKTCVVANNIVSNEDPGFVDMAALDLRLRPDAPVFKRMPGFQAPDFAKMGLYDDPRRASPAVKFGPGVQPIKRILSPQEIGQRKG